MGILTLLLLIYYHSYYYYYYHQQIRLLSLYYYATYPRLFNYLLKAIIVAIAIALLLSARLSSIEHQRRILTVVAVISLVVFITFSFCKSLLAVVIFGKMFRFADDDFLTVNVFNKTSKINKFWNNLHRCNSIHSKNDILAGW